MTGEGGEGLKIHMACIRRGIFVNEYITSHIL